MTLEGLEGRTRAATPRRVKRAGSRLPSGDRRSQILAAALEVFAERGFHGTRTRELAERAGVSEALLFRHFPTKDALIRAILESLRIQDQIDRLEAVAEDKAPREALEAIAEHLLTLVAREPQRMRLEL